MQKRYAELPEGYRESFSIDLQKNKKEFWIVNLGSVLLALFVILIGHLIVPIGEWIGTIFEEGLPLGRVLIFLASLFAYIILHEAVHGVTMKAVGTPKVRFGFTGAYAFAGSSDYYAKMPYFLIAVMPVLFWGIVLAILCAVADRDWFWFLHLLQTMNISGAAGDLYVIFRLIRKDKSILVRDTGVAMMVYEKTEQ